MIEANTLRPVTGAELRHVQGGFIGGVLKKIGSAVGSAVADRFKSVYRGVATVAGYAKRYLVPYL